jgi:hypothetical protein
MSCPNSIVGCVKDVVSAPTALAGKAIGAAGGNFAASLAGSVVDDWANACAKAADWAVKNLMTAWLHSPDPDLTGASSPTVWLQQKLVWLTPVVMLSALLVGAYRLAITRRAEHGRDLAAALLRTVIVSVAAGVVLTCLLGVGDAFTTWILAASPVDFAPSMVFAASSGAFPSVVVIVLGLVVFVTQLLQYGLMLIRNAMIVLLAGVLPVTAAASNTATGKQAWAKATAWLTAFTLYKPVAALIYATAFRMTSRDQAPSTVVAGVLLMVLAIFALPALLRFLVPATTAMASGNAGAAAGAVVSGTLAAGAVALSGGLGAAAGGFARAGATAMPTGAKPMGSGAGGGVPGARAGMAMQGANSLRGKGSGGKSSSVVGGHE